MHRPGVGVAFLLWRFSKDLPDYEVLAKYEPPVMTRVHASNGSLIAEYGEQRRIYVPINTIPEKLIQAFLAAEDKNFYQHGGIDFQGIVRGKNSRTQRTRINVERLRLGSFSLLARHIAILGHTVDDPVAP